jgi:hypothetical protein
MSFKNHLVGTTAICFGAMALWIPINILASQLDEMMEAGEESA